MLTTTLIAARNCPTSLTGGEGALEAIVFINSRKVSGSVTCSRMSERYFDAHFLKDMLSDLRDFIEKYTYQVKREFSRKLLDLQVLERDKEDRQKDEMVWSKDVLCRRRVFFHRRACSEVG